jgi:4-amino-4-deoxy-L-arabinose transferase-like glycosyltransferase
VVGSREFASHKRRMRFLKLLATSLTAIILITALCRITFAYIETKRIPTDQIARAVFQTEAGSIARSIAQGRGFSSPYERESGPTAILPPVYPLIVAAVFRIFGVQSAASFHVLVFLNIVFAALTCVPIYKIGQRLGGVRVAAIATWLWALFPNSILIPFEWIWETSLSALLAATILWATLELAEGKPLRKRLAYCLLWGLTLMTNPALGAAFPILFFWAAWPRKVSSAVTQEHTGKLPLTKNLIRPTLALFIALLCCAPWTIRNFATFHRFIPFRSGFAFELYIGNNENYSLPYVWPPRISYERELLRYLRMGEIPFMDEEKQKALSFIHAHPNLFLQLSAHRFVEFWTGTSEPINAWRTYPSFLDRLFLLLNLLLPLAALAGAIRLLISRSSYALPLLALPVFFPIVYYITHSSLRYRHPIDPILFLLSAAICIRM